MRSLFTNRPILILLIVAVILFVGNLIAHTSQTKQATAQTPTHKPIMVETNLHEALSNLPAPRIGLPAKDNPKPTIYSKSYLVMDTETKYPLLAKNPDTPVPIASTTKIMTALVTLDTQKDLDRVVVIPREAAAVEGSDIQLLTGETMTVKNLLYALMLNSANDAAYALSMIDGSKDQFVSQMNAKAKALGLRNTAYKDPAGLDDTGHSSPRDLAILMGYALNNSLFRTLVGTSKHTIMSADGKYAHELQNSNRLVDQEEPLYLPNVVGGKTGFTYEAGHCLVAAAKGVDGKQYIAVVLHTLEETKEASAKEARKLLVWATQ